MKVFVASDHAGFLYKKQLIHDLQSELADHFHFEDLGSFDESRVDYPDYANLVAMKVSNGEGAGLLICGSGIGMCIRANRYPGVRAALCWDLASARLARSHNDGNILCLGARLIPQGLGKEIAKIFFGTAFEGGRHSARIEKLDKSL